jgi:outer membrane protein with glycine zipper
MNRESTKTNVLLIVSGMSLGCLFLSSCDTPVGQGAAWGAATGAIIGGAATGNVRAASIGAAAGAAAGALTGKIVQENQAAGYGPPPPGGYPYARWAGDRGFSIALTPDAFTIFAACRPVDLRATLIRVGFSASHRQKRRADQPVFQRRLACSLSTAARASSVIFNNSGHGR